MHVRAIFVIMARTTGRKDLTQDERQQLIGFLKALQNQNEKLPVGAMTAAARAFHCHRNTVQNVWQKRDGNKPVRGGSKRKHDAVTLNDAIQRVPFSSLQTVR